MEDSRYAPPATADLLVQEGGPSFLRPPRPPRPIAIWLMMVVMGAFLAGTVIGLVASFGLVSLGAVSFVAWFARLVVLLALFSLLGALAFGLWRGKRWGRWIGLALIVALALWATIGRDTTDYANESERLGGTTAKYLFGPMLYAWWAYALAFSTKARRYFGLLQD